MKSEQALPAAPRRCIACKHWSPRRGSPALARQGFAPCAIKSRHDGHTFSATWPRECKTFLPVAAEAEAARRAFIDRPKPVARVDANENLR